MGKKSTPAQPAAPDPVATAQAQGQMNKETAVATQHLNMVDQKTPYGTLKYNKIGSWAEPGGQPAQPSGASTFTGGAGTGGGSSFLGGMGTTLAGTIIGNQQQKQGSPSIGYEGLPRYEAVTELSPEEQGLLDQQREFDKRTNQLGIDQTARLTDHLGKPIQLNNEATEARLAELGRKRMDPMWSERRSGLETKLANQGLAPGTEAYSREMARLGEQENDAYNQLFLTGRGQAVQEALTERNQPINEITALMGAQQMQQPNFINTPQTQVQGVDYTGLVSNNYATQMAGYNAAQQAAAQKQAAMMGGVAGMISAPMGGWARGMGR